MRPFVHAKFKNSNGQTNRDKYKVAGKKNMFEMDVGLFGHQFYMLKLTIRAIRYVHIFINN